MQLSSFDSEQISSTGTLQQIEYNVSGIFTPPPGVGLIYVTAVGGGSSGASGNVIYVIYPEISPGQNAPKLFRYPMTVSGPINITIGAGGGAAFNSCYYDNAYQCWRTRASYGQPGGNTCVGELVIPGGWNMEGNYGWGYSVPTFMDTTTKGYGGSIYLNDTLYASNGCNTTRLIPKANGQYVCQCFGNPNTGAGSPGGQNASAGYVLIEYFL